MVLFIYFGCLIVLIRMSNTVLNRSGESGHPSLILDLKEKTLSLNIKYNISCRFLVDPLHQVDKVPSANFYLIYFGSDLYCFFYLL